MHSCTLVKETMFVLLDTVCLLFSSVMTLLLLNPFLNFGLLEYHSSQDLILQDAALKLRVLTSEEFDNLVVPEKMIGPSD